MPTLADVYQAQQKLTSFKSTAKANPSQFNAAVMNQQYSNYLNAQSLYNTAQNSALNAARANARISYNAAAGAYSGAGSIGGYGSGGSSGSGAGGGGSDVISAFTSLDPAAARAASARLQAGTQAGNEAYTNAITRGQELYNMSADQAIELRKQGRADIFNEIGIGVDRSRSALAKLREFGESAIDKLSALSGLSGSAGEQEAALMADPSYKFRYEQGQKAVAQGLAARGIGGGQAAKELTEFGQGLASTEFSNITNRLQNIIGLYSPAALQESQQQLQAGIARAGFVDQEMQGLANIELQRGRDLMGSQELLGQRLADSATALGAARASLLRDVGVRANLVTQSGVRTLPSVLSSAYNNI